jgi:hypothetical protein
MMFLFNFIYFIKKMKINLIFLCLFPSTKAIYIDNLEVKFIS